MTTSVMVKASGPCYPVRVRIFDKDDDIVRDFLIPSDHTYTLNYIDPGHRLEIYEEYHVNGYYP